jgi:crotonobetainyl-CoA:carnitine CoA-transferase CaiB-like acyl-CoA transferase
MTSVCKFGALQGLRVIDLTQVLAGPFCTMMLADHGAEIIKVEPIEGESTRRVGPFHPDDGLRAFGGYFQSVNRNKKSLALDLKTEEGRDILLRLADTADLLVENFRVGVMDRLGLSYETLSARNPRLVYVSIRGFGDPRTGESPYVDWPAFDVIAQAMGGLISINGPGVDLPLKSGPGVGDIVPALMAAFGGIAAVLRARESGCGQYVDIAMTDGVLALCERLVHQFSYQGKVPRPEGNRHPLLCPFGVVEAKDGWVAIACHRDHFWADLCGLIGREELIADPGFATNEARLANAAAVYEVVSEYTRGSTKRELMERLGGRIPFGPVFDAGDIEDDPHFRARMFAEVEHPGLEQPMRIAGVPIRMTKTPGGVHRRAPLAGEDNDDILHGMGFSAADLERYRKAGVIA